MSEADTTNNLYGVHVLHTDTEGDWLTVQILADGRHLFDMSHEDGVYATTDELRAAARKILALCDRLDAAEGKTSEPDTEFVPADDALIGRVLAYGNRLPEFWAITRYHVDVYGAWVYCVGGHQVRFGDPQRVEVVG